MTFWDFAHAHFVGLAVLLVVLLVFLDSTVVNWMRSRLMRDLTTKKGVSAKAAHEAAKTVAKKWPRQQ